MLECFHMTSRWPYWGMPQNNETGAMLVCQTDPDWPKPRGHLMKFTQRSIRYCFQTSLR